MAELDIGDFELAATDDGYSPRASAMSFLRPIASSGIDILTALPEMGLSALGGISSLFPETSRAAESLPFGELFRFGRGIAEANEAGTDWRTSSILKEALNNLSASEGTPYPWAEGTGEILGAVNEFVGGGGLIRGGMKRLGVKAAPKMVSSVPSTLVGRVVDKAYRTPVIADTLAGLGAGTARAVDASPEMELIAALGAGLIPGGAKALGAAPNLLRKGAVNILAKGQRAGDVLAEALLNPKLKGKTLPEVAALNLTETSPAARVLRSELSNKIPGGRIPLAAIAKSTRETLDDGIARLFPEPKELKLAAAGESLMTATQKAAAKDLAPITKKYNAIKWNKKIPLDETARKTFYKAAKEGANLTSLDKSISRELNSLIDQTLQIANDPGITNLSNQQMKGLLHGITKLKTRVGDDERRIFSRMQKLFEQIAPSELVEANKEYAQFASKYKLTGRGQNILSEIFETVTTPSGEKLPVKEFEQLAGRLGKLSSAELAELDNALGARTVDKLLRQSISPNIGKEVRTALKGNDPNAVDDLSRLLKSNREILSRIYGRDADEMVSFLQKQRPEVLKRLEDSEFAGIRPLSSSEMFPGEAVNMTPYARGVGGFGGVTVHANDPGIYANHANEIAFKALLPEEARGLFGAEDILPGWTEIFNAPARGIAARVGSPAYSYREEPDPTLLNGIDIGEFEL